MYYTATISCINELIEVHNDRIQLCNMAISKSANISLNERFKVLSASSKAATDYLIFEIRKLNGSPIEETTSLGKMAGIWKEMESYLIQKDTKSVLNACIIMGAIIIGVYDLLLQKNLAFIPAYMLPVIKSQLKLLQQEKLLLIAYQCKFKSDVSG